MPPPKHTPERGDSQNGGGGGFVAEANREVEALSEETGLAGWQVVAVLAVVVLGLAGAAAWCAFRFFRKKRKPKEETKKGKKDEDEDVLVENEEEDDALKDTASLSTAAADGKNGKEYLGKLQYELRYDFNTQTLTVKVVQAVDLPAMDLGGVSDPYVKLYLMPESKGKKSKFETKVHRQTLYPFFNQSFAVKDLPYAATFDKPLMFSVSGLSLRPFTATLTAFSCSTKRFHLRFPFLFVLYSSLFHTDFRLRPLLEARPNRRGELAYYAIIDVSV